MILMSFCSRFIMFCVYQ